ncbi:biliverdin-producing heme oxygenase [Kribbella sp. NBC_01245]|uniref:biliverdin-producing heme oxygenase n=1 Tax=Kribbella sp. NBC_01245 TaxID=2903578 RepID=UPI002E286235|nr:biliverdin-producing heme oxygenase [Kribbella sp. NBC_01245]
MTRQSDSMAQLPLSARFREQSRQVHREAAESRFLAALTDGSLDLAGYAALVTQHAAIYRGIEQLADSFAGHPVAGVFVFPELYRTPALTADLKFLHGTGAKHESLTPATERYVARLAELTDWPGGFVAHHYVRYLGDLSGGQAIGRSVAQQYGLTNGGDGLRFYDFDKVASPKLFKDRYRELLNEADWDEADQTRILGEIDLAFRFNLELLIDLADEVLPRYPKVAS